MKYIENQCHICREVFCCIICRDKHGTKDHNIFPGCDICLQGITNISSINTDVFSHIKQRHWPLHCVLCKRLFGSTDEIALHVKCPLAKTSNTLVTPYNSAESVKLNLDEISPLYLSEKTGKMFNELATSTPLQSKANNEQKECASQKKVKFSMPSLEESGNASTALVGEVSVFSTPVKHANLDTNTDDEESTNEANTSTTEINEKENDAWLTAVDKLPDADNKPSRTPIVSLRIKQKESIRIKLEGPLSSTPNTLGIPIQNIDQFLFNSESQSPVANIRLSRSRNYTFSRAVKRTVDTDQVDLQIVKRFKSSDIKCRKTIRPMTPLAKYLERARKPKNSVTTKKVLVDKSTQTDESFFRRQIEFIRNLF
ncbi:unnamed protein product [Phyllotreta striolata]|uniref:Uncharacterized protein n=1 Tax=Phyllotreta striolata TaxID=444603 RepID=A0A9N9XIC7_PHYSR|nr:unnamed protein product [Phyllotreta striolata]